MAKRIGDILIEMGFIDRDQLEMAATESKKTGVMLGDVLLRLDWITQEQLQMSLAVQSGALVVEINIEPSEISHICDIKYHGKSGEILPQIVKKIKELKNI